MRGVVLAGFFMIRSSGVSRSITLLLIALAVTLIAHFLPDAETKTWGDGTNGTGAAKFKLFDRSCRHIAFAFRGKHDRNRRRYFVDLGLERDG
jgi:hypothetical protein